MKKFMSILILVCMGFYSHLSAMNHQKSAMTLPNPGDMQKAPNKHPLFSSPDTPSKSSPPNKQQQLIEIKFPQTKIEEILETLKKPECPQYRLTIDGNFILSNFETMPREKFKLLMNSIFTIPPENICSLWVLHAHIFTNEPLEMIAEFMIHFTNLERIHITHTNVLKEKKLKFEQLKKISTQKLELIDISYCFKTDFQKRKETQKDTIINLNLHKFFYYLLKNSPNIRDISYCNNELYDDQAVSIIGLLTPLASLEYINFSGNKLTRSSLKAVFTILNKKASTHSLTVDLSYNSALFLAPTKPTERFFHDYYFLIQKLKQLPKGFLGELNLTGIRFPDETTARLCAKELLQEANMPDNLPESFQVQLKNIAKEKGVKLITDQLGETSALGKK